MIRRWLGRKLYPRHFQRYFMREILPELADSINKKTTIDCPRCGPVFMFENSRCVFCGMHPKVQGPPRPFEPRGINWAECTDLHEQWAVEAIDSAGYL